MNAAGGASVDPVMQVGVSLELEQAIRFQRINKAILEAALDCIITMDADGRVLEFNRAAQETFGYARDEVIGRDMADVIIPPEFRERHRAGFRRHLETGETTIIGRRLELSALRRDGSTFPVEVAISRIDWNGPPIFCGYLRDITERKRYEQELLERTRLSSLTADIGLILTRADTLRDMLQNCAEAVVRKLDAAFARIWTLNGEEHVLELQASAGMYTHLDGPHGRVPVGKFKIGMIAEQRQPHLTNEVLGDPRVGDQEWARREGMVAFAGYPLMVDDELVGVLAMFARHPLRDVDLQALGTVANGIALGIQRKRHDDALKQRAEELARLAEALERSNRELDAFAYAASHDLRAPLRGIANLAHWIEEDLQGALRKETREMLALLRNRMQRMERLIEGLLQYSRVGRAHQRPETVYTATLVREVLDLLAPPPDARIEIDPDLPTFATERLPLQQVFMNLLSNALKYASLEAPLVRVSARKTDGYWEFTVEDNGPGIALEFQERIWGIFQTLQPRDKVEGTGIGLALVRKIVETQGGRAWVESSPGEGARFKFRWPEAEVRNGGSRA